MIVVLAVLFAVFGGAILAVVLLQDQWAARRGKARVGLVALVAVLLLPSAAVFAGLVAHGAYNHCRGRWLDNDIEEGETRTDGEEISGQPRLQFWPPGFDCNG